MLKVGGCKVKQEPQVIEQTVVMRAVIGSVVVSRSKVLDIPGFMDAASTSSQHCTTSLVAPISL